MKFLNILVLILFLTTSTKSSSQVLDCPRSGGNAGPDQTICPIPGSVQIGTLSQSLLFSYFWTPENGLDNPYISNPVASPTNITTYTLTTTGANLIQNGNFEQGNIGFLTDYNLYIGTWGVGTYAITSNPSFVNSPYCSTPNHTPGGNQMMVVDGFVDYQPNSNFWAQNVSVTPNVPLLMSAWFYSASELNYYDPPYDPFWPIIEIKINGTILSTTALPYNKCGPWYHVEFPYTPLTNQVFIEMRSSTFWGGGGGNDFAVDDISLSCYDKDEVIVRVCSPTVISNNSYFQFGGCNPPPANNTLPIIPNMDNNFCYYWECAGSSHFYSSIPGSGNIWYINDIQIPNSPNSSSPFYGSVSISNQGVLTHSKGVGFGNYFKFQVQNNTLGNTPLSQPTYIYYGSIIGPYVENVGTYKPNLIKDFAALPFGNNTGPNAVYSWSIPGCGVNNLDPSGYNFQVNFPNNIGTGGINGNVTISNSLCANGTFPIYFTYSNSAKGFNLINEENLSISPNPSTNIVSLKVFEGNILSIKIQDLYGTVIKYIKVLEAPTATINISDLRSGFYNCSVLTTNGTISKKIIVNH